MTNRQDIHFVSNGLKCAGWFYRSPNQGKKSPCVILAHGFGAVREMRLDAFAERFAEAGYHALVFDYRHFGSSEGEPRQILNIKKQHQDWQAAIDYAKTIPGVDVRKIVLWGTSFSGGHVLALGVKNPDIAAVISQVPHMDGIAFLETLRSDPRFQQLPVLIVTAKVLTPQEKEQLRRQRLEFVKKAELSQDGFMRLLQRILQQTGSGRKKTSTPDPANPG